MVFTLSNAIEPFWNVFRTEQSRTSPCSWTVASCDTPTTLRLPFWITVECQNTYQVGSTSPACYNYLPGLHINLSEGQPVRPKASISTLVDPTSGLFYTKTGIRQNLEKINLQEIEKEVEGQLIKYIDLFDVSPPRLDGHQHCHVLPGVVDVLCRLLPRYDVKWIRVPQETLFKHPNYREILSTRNLDGMFF